MVHSSILSTIGDTPMVKLISIVPPNVGEVYCKVEFLNPMHSIKDRVALNMIESAERNGDLRKGMKVIEPTSGNTGIGLAMVCAAKGYRITLTMPENMSVERVRLLRAMGADVILTPAIEGMKGAVDKARELCAQDVYYMPMQFENPANVEAHYNGTGQEIFRQLPDIDAFVAGIGTGGTVTGVGRSLKEKREVLVFGVEPARSPVISEGRSGTHGIQGIGAGFIPSILDMGVVDGIITVRDEDAFRTTVDLARKEGIFAGISSGANVFAAIQLAAELGEGRKIVTVLPDSGERYLSTDLFRE